MVERRGKKIPQNAEELFGLQEEEFNTLFADKETKPETKGADDGMGLEKEIREEELLAMAAERGIVPLVEACRSAAQRANSWPHPGGAGILRQCHGYKAHACLLRTGR